MNIERLIEYSLKPSLFQDGTAVMWTDPYISGQLLECHIEPSNDVASRSDEKIESLVDWMLSKTEKKKLDVLDLGCGPGLYAEKFAARGHRVTGVDFSRTSIEYAKGVTERNRSLIEYRCDNYLNLKYENAFDLAILIYLDFCVLKPAERKLVLDNVFASLRPGGAFIFDVVNGRRIDEKIPKQSWEVRPKGFWRDEPYVALHNGYHYPEEKVFVEQHVVMDGGDKIDSYLFWNIYYEYADLKPFLNNAGFRKIDCFENVLPEGDVWNGDNVTFYRAEK